MTALEAYILARAYTQQAIAGAGALKGAPCQIQSIIPITGGNRITFAWENSEGVTETDTLDVMDGVDGTNGTDGTDGTDGVGISSITFKEKDASGNNVYTVTLSNTNTYDITCPIGPQGETGSTGATGATGNGIASITKTGTEGLVDTYTITYTNGQTSTFTVTNGQTPTVDSAMSDSSANPVENRVIDAQLKTKANQTQLATVEASTTASKAYSANEYLVLGGVLYKVTDNIAQGGTIVTEGAGKNVDLATVGGELATLKSGLLKSWSLGWGNSIANNTDLNDITTVGNYYATLPTSPTLSHCPTTVAFKLKVLYDVREGAPTYIEQVINPMASYDEYRRYKAGDVNWSDWHLTNCNLDDINSKLNTVIPDAPTADGAYVLTVTVANGTPSYGWVLAT